MGNWTLDTSLLQRLQSPRDADKDVLSPRQERASLCTICKTLMSGAERCISKKKLELRLEPDARVMDSKGSDKEQCLKGAT